MNNKQYFVQIPNNSTIGAEKQKGPLSDFAQADQIAKDNFGLLYELENGQTMLDMDENNNITGGKLIKDYSR